jgi:hypothetical protein
MERAEWWMDGLEPGAPEERSVSAFPTGYRLSSLQMKDSFLESQPLDAPKISWTVYKGPGYRTLVMGGQAPSLLMGQARAEAIWRIDAGVRSDA